jgi:CheY-like chemotaxis protein
VTSSSVPCTLAAVRKSLLEEAGYTVLSATSETEALQVLREAPVRLVLPDHMLRGTTGTELAAKLRHRT